MLSKLYCFSDKSRVANKRHAFKTVPPLSTHCSDKSSKSRLCTPLHHQDPVPMLTSNQSINSFEHGYNASGSITIPGFRINDSYSASSWTFTRSISALNTSNNERELTQDISLQTSYVPHLLLHQESITNKSSPAQNKASQTLPQ